MSAAELVPSVPAATRVWRRNFKVFSKVWKGALLPQFFDPLFYLLALGFGLGTYLATVNGIPYKQFVGAGLMSSAVMWAATFETTWNIFFKMEETRLYDSVLSTPVEVQDLVLAEMAWAATRAVIYGTTFTVIVAAFGLVDSPWAVLTPLFLALGGACFGMLGLTFTSLIKTMDWYSFYYTLFITPLFLFSGIFYPLTRLPDWVHVIAWFTPLYHLVQITRGLVLGPDALSVLGNALWLLVVIVALFPIPVRALRRRLVA
ncbi:MAG: ABC transporter permease [Thermoleophilaceae bacterium]|jgi:lipooligosaccharide transport system permease protein